MLIHADYDWDAIDEEAAREGEAVVIAVRSMVASAAPRAHMKYAGEHDLQRSGDDMDPWQSVRYRTWEDNR